MEKEMGMKFYLVKIDTSIANCYFYYVTIGGYSCRDRSCMDARFESMIQTISDVSNMSGNAILDWSTRFQASEIERYKSKEVLAEGESLRDLIAPFPWAML